MRSIYCFILICGILVSLDVHADLPSCADHLRSSAEILPFKMRRPPTPLAEPEFRERQKLLLECAQAAKLPDYEINIVRLATNSEKFVRLQLLEKHFLKMQKLANDSRDPEVQNAAQIAISRWQATHFIEHLERSIDSTQLKPNGRPYDVLNEEQSALLAVLRRDIPRFSIRAALSRYNISRLDSYTSLIRMEVRTLIDELSILNDDLENVFKALSDLEALVLNNPRILEIEAMPLAEIEKLELNPVQRMELNQSLQRIGSLRTMIEYVRSRGLRGMPDRHAVNDNLKP